METKVTATTPPNTSTSPNSMWASIARQMKEQTDSKIQMGTDPNLSEDEIKAIIEVAK